MDFGVARGKFQLKQENEPLITSKMASMPTFLLSMCSHDICEYSLQPVSLLPLVVDRSLNKYGNSSSLRTVYTNQDGELAPSHAFQRLIAKHNYIVETTPQMYASKTTAQPPQPRS